MNATVTPAQIEQYQKDGFVVLHDFLSPEELEDWRTQVEEAVADRLKVGGWLQNQNDPDSYYSQVFTQCLKLLETHAGVRRLMLDERLGRVAGELAKVDGIRIWHDQALFKPPFGNPTGWHLDNPYWSFSSPDAISLWVALDDATEANGCLYYLPGTHKTARYENSGIGNNIGALLSIYPEWRQIASVATPCKAGSAVLHNGLVAHGAGANMTHLPRRAMTCAYMPMGSTFNGVRNVLPEEYFNTLTVGDVLANDEVNPLIWTRA